MIGCVGQPGKTFIRAAAAPFVPTFGIAEDAGAPGADATEEATEMGASVMVVPC